MPTIALVLKKQHRKLLRFSYAMNKRDVKVYEFQALPNGLTSGPRLFTKITKPIFSHLRKLGYDNSPYIDDCFLVGDTEVECMENVKATVEISTQTGFIVHPTKSVLKPTQILEQLGFVLNSLLMNVSIYQRQATKIINACENLINSTQCTTMQFAQAVGLLVASFPGVEHGPLFYCRLDNAKNLALRQNKGDFKATMELNAELKLDLQWWRDNIHNTCNPISHGNPTVSLASDASKTGWGGVYGDLKTGGQWTPAESKLHSNYLELLAVWFTIRSFLHNQYDIHAMLHVDNTTALSYINNMGGKITTLNDLTRKIWMWCRERKIWINAVYTASTDNFEADKESRSKHENTEWMLNSELFDKLCTVMGKPDIDLFASRTNKQLDRYISWRPDPFAVAVDAFSVNWTNMNAYIFPPFCMIELVLQKIVLDRAEQAIIIVPYRTTQPWFTKLGKLLTKCPFLLPRSSNTLHHPTLNKDHKLRKLQLIACSISGDNMKTLDFRKRQPKYSWHHGEKTLKNNRKFTSLNGYAFVVKDIIIQCVRM